MFELLDAINLWVHRIGLLLFVPLVIVLAVAFCAGQRFYEFWKGIVKRWS